MTALAAVSENHVPVLLFTSSLAREVFAKNEPPMERTNGVVFRIRLHRH